jgi:hypothetical protein
MVFQPFFSLGQKLVDLIITHVLVLAAVERWQKNVEVVQ